MNSTSSSSRASLVAAALTLVVTCLAAACGDEAASAASADDGDSGVGSGVDGGSPADAAGVVDGRADSSGGTVVRNSAVFYPNLTQDLKSGNAGALRLIAHELFHLWNGSTMENASDAEWSDGKYGWFKEGFTEYYSGATLYREGIFDNAEFATFVNHLIVEYAQNGESLHATLDEMGSRHWKDRDHQQLPYTKGALLAVLMDLQLRARSRSLDDYMRAILPKGTYDLSNLRDAGWHGG